MGSYSYYAQVLSLCIDNVKNLNIKSNSYLSATPRVDVLILQVWSCLVDKFNTKHSDKSKVEVRRADISPVLKSLHWLPDSFTIAAFH